VTYAKMIWYQMTQFLTICNLIDFIQVEAVRTPQLRVINASVTVFQLFVESIDRHKLIPS